MPVDDITQVKINPEPYANTDQFFGAPWIDVDEWREHPAPHRHVHGGFSGTDTRFTFYFPPAAAYEGRMYQPLEGANGGHEDSFGNEHGNLLGGLDMIVRLGGFMVESNMGHIGDVPDPKAGDDPTIYGFRAAAETGRFAKFVGAQIYGTPPHHSYVWGGSGGARRSPLCLQYAPDVWDGALPFMGDAMVGDHGDFSRLKGGGGNFAAMFNVQRLLGPKINDVVDAMQPGGSGDPFAGLDTNQRQELATLYRLGYPRGDEWVISQPSGTIWLWCSMADRMQEDDPEYFEAFWSRPGYVGHDQPEVVAGDVIDRTATVKRVFTAQDFMDDPKFQAPEFNRLRPSAVMLAGTRGFDLPIAIELDELAGYKLGMGVRILTGKAAGRQLYCMYHAGDVVLCDGGGDASNLRFTDVLAGDEVRLDNRAFLAYCYHYRHHVNDFDEWQFLKVDGVPIYPQHPLPTMSPFMGVRYSGQYEGKLMWVHHTHDASLWPPQGIGYLRAVERAQGPEGVAARFRLRWTENAEHVPAEFVPAQPKRATNTWLIDYRPVIEQCLADLGDWVERGIEPAGSNFSYADGYVTLPPTAAERGGIQPVVKATANGAARTEVQAGEPVTLVVEAEVPPGAGTIISAEWDFDGSGSYPFKHDGIDGTATKVLLTTTHTWDRPGTYFASALVKSHREGDVDAPSRRVPNLASARIVVT
ncbi:MAG: PKD domain-containing protein [Acidimicrobiales bacterium]